LASKLARCLSSPCLRERMSLCILRLEDLPTAGNCSPHWRKESMTDRIARITVNPEQCGGRPCVRGMRIRVSDVLDLLAAGLTREQVLEELPDLEPEDVAACLRFASQRLDHPVIAA